MTILEKDLAHEHIPIDIAAGEQSTGDYSTRSCNHLEKCGPVLDDGGLMIFESRATRGVCKYLAR